MAYKLQKNGSGVIRLSDGACIPECDANRDWQEYREWATRGNTPAPAYTPEELAEQQTAIRANATDAHLRFLAEL